MTPPTELPDVLQIGEQVERYVVEARIGVGGLAVVYRVRHVHLDTVHALKVLLVTTPTDRARLLAEGQVQARLQHPNVVAVSDVLTVHRSPALVMELVDGPSLAAFLQQSRGPIPFDTAQHLFRGIVSGVGAAHAAGLVHRDLKPANVLLKPVPGRLPTAKVTDFGLVRSMHSDGVGTLSGASVGTPAYMSPEQIRDPGSVDTRADLWALGALLYELVHGRRAFDHDDTFDLYRAISDGAHPPIDPIDPRWASAIEDLLEVDPTQRIGSCVELWNRLWPDPPPAEWNTDLPISITPPPRMSSRLDTHQVPVPAPPVAPPTPLPTRRRTLAAAVVVAALLGALVAVVGSKALRPPAPPPITAPPDPAPSAPPGPVTAPAPASPAPRPADEPAVVELRPADSPAPHPAAAAFGRVTVEGDAVEVWLVDGSGARTPVGDAVPAGAYVVLARWGDDEDRTAGRVTVVAGDTVALRCSGFLFACAAIPSRPPPGP